MYTTYTEFIETFNVNPGYDRKVPFKLYGATHINSDYTRWGITRFEGIITSNQLLKQMIVASTRQDHAVHSYPSTTIINKQVYPYVKYVIYFDKPFRQDSMPNSRKRELSKRALDIYTMLITLAASVFVVLSIFKLIHFI